MKLYLRFIPMVLIMGIIFYLSHQPGGFVRLPQITGLDKLFHAVAYGVLAASLLYGLQPFTHEADRIVIALAVVGFCLIFGLGDEFHQSFVPGRSVSGWDVAADVFGASFVAGLWYIKSLGRGGRICS